jgi:hypothetical protein
MKVTIKEGEQIMMKIEEALGFTKHDFHMVDDQQRLIYTKWGSEDDYIDIEDLGNRSLKINGKLGDIYIDKIRTDGYVIVGAGTSLHCDDLHAGEEVITDYKGFIH